MLQKVKEYVAKWDMLKKGDRIIAGVSGGADSICLLFVLLELQKEIPFELVVVHVNHKLRGADADADEAYVKGLCKKYGITFQSYSRNVELIAKNRKQSTEEAGREVRREAFWEAMKTYGATKIALAHHKNDSVETFLMNLARGTGLKGLGGIRPVAGEYIRPLLCLERAEIEEYLHRQGIAYCVDVTNSQDHYTRNRIRNHVIPYLEREVNVKTVSHMTETMRQLQQIQGYLEEQTEIYFERSVKKEDGGYLVLAEQFENVPEVLQSLVIRKVLVTISGKEKDLEEIHLKSLQELLKKQVGKGVDLPYGMAGKRVYDGLYLSEKNDKTEEVVCFELDFSKGNEQTFFWKGKHITGRLLEKGAEDTKGEQKNDTKWFDYDIINDKVSIRTRKPGDYITIHSDGRRQKIKSLFVNEKIPQEKRGEILLVADGSHIMWVPGVRTNCMYQVCKHTKRVLEIRINEGENHGREN